MNSLTEIVPVSPKTDFLYAANAAQLSENDMPTVAETLLPYATAQIAKPIETSEKSFGELWKAYFYNSGSYPEM